MDMYRPSDVNDELRQALQFDLECAQGELKIAVDRISDKESKTPRASLMTAIVAINIAIRKIERTKEVIDEILQNS